TGRPLNRRTWSRFLRRSRERSRRRSAARPRCLGRARAELLVRFRNSRYAGRDWESAGPSRPSARLVLGYNAASSSPRVRGGGRAMRQGGRISLGVLLIVAWMVSAGGRGASASHTCSGPEACGQNSGLVPFVKDGIMASLIWPDAEAQCPKMMIWMRPAEFKPKDYLSPTVGGVFSGFNQKYQIGRASCRERGVCMVVE